MERRLEKIIASIDVALGGATGEYGRMFARDLAELRALPGGE